MTLTSQQAIDLLQSQLKEWELARTNYEALEKVETKEFTFDTFSVQVQFNPARIQSSAAKVDTQSILERKCFLCSANRPEVQKGIDYKGKYQLLVNPFPIFPQHFTIPSNEHVDQLILERYEDMLDLAKCLDQFTLFYNGPKCGASAPDHIHFQAGSKGFLPIETEVLNISKTAILQKEGITVYAVKDYFRNSFFLEASDINAASDFFRKLYALLEIPEGENEPKMNIITWYKNEKWHSSIIPRQKHRPDCFAAEGDDNLLISPASVDMGGVFITPIQKDFDKISKKDIENILKEICIDDARLKKLSMKIEAM